MVCTGGNASLYSNQTICYGGREKNVRIIFNDRDINDNNVMYYNPKVQLQNPSKRLNCIINILSCQLPMSNDIVKVRD